MGQILLVTGNANKLAEWRRLLPEDIRVDSVNVDLPEIQNIDPEEIVADKAKRAYEAVGKPVVVEDVAAGLNKLNGLPGPFIKFFLKEIGEDALFILAGQEGDEATVSCSIAYYDGQKLLTVKGSVRGTVVMARGINGFGFDKTFVPEGEIKTYAEMSPDEKDRVSHRHRAISLFVELLRSGG